MSSFEEQLQRYNDRVYGYACYMLDDREAAADVTQEVLVRFWEHFAEIDEDGALGWLLRTTRNACIDALRKRQTQQRYFRAGLSDVPTPDGAAPSPADDAESADFRRHLKQALSRIDEPYRSVVILREVQELAYKEISGALDMPLNTVKVYVHRGRKKLRKQLREVTNHEFA